LRHGTAAVVAVAVCIGSGGYLLRTYVSRERREFLEGWQRDVDAHAASAKAAIDQWVASGIGEAETVAAFPSAVRRARLHGREAHEEGPYHLEEVLAILIRVRGYKHVVVLDAAGTAVARAPQDPPLDPGVFPPTTRVAAATPSVELRRGGKGAPVVVFTAPLIHEGRVAGTVAVVADPEVWLYPVLATQVSEPSSEAFLAEKRGDSLVYLSPLRGRPGAVFSERTVPTASGGTLFADGDADAPVLAAERTIAGTPWRLVVQVGRAEALASFRRRETELMAGAFAAVLATGVAALLFFRARRSAQRASIVLSRARFAMLLDEANDALLLVDRDGRLLDANRHAESTYGYDRGALLGMRFMDLHTETTRVKAALQLAMTADSGGGVFESRHSRSDGTTFPVEMSAQRAALGEQAVVVCVVRDLTARQSSERRVRHLNDLLRTISEIDETIVRIESPELLFGETCRILVERGRFRMAWIGLADREEQRVRPVAWAGIEEGYVRDLSVRLDDTPEGRGPVGTAVRTGSHVAVEDTAADPSVEPWREAQLARGYRSIGAFPFRRRGEVVGCIAVYSGEPGAIGPDETGILRDLAVDIGFALDAFADRAERAEAEKGLRRQNEVLQAIVEQAPIMIAFQDAEGRPYLFNRELERVLGWSVKDALATEFLPQVLADPVDLPRARHLLEAADGQWGLFRIRTRDRKVVDATFACVRLADGTRISLGQDISHLRSVDERIAALSRAVDDSPASIVMTDRDGRIEYVNRKFTEVTGYTLEECLGQNPRILKSGETPPEVYEDMWRTISAGGEWRGELCNRRKDGKLIWERSSISGVSSDDGAIMHFVALKEDITEQRRSEAALRQSQLQLLQSTKMEAVGRLAGGVAHDFNNLLGVIVGYADLLLRGLPEGDPQRSRVEQIARAAGRAADLTRQLLAFSRKQVLEPKILSVESAVGETEKMLRRLIGEDVEFVVASRPPVGRVRADPGQIEQVLVNLAVNARDAMPDGGTLSIEMANVDVDESYAALHEPFTPGRYVRITVSDTGVGMDKETQTHIFEPFFTTKEKGKGTGLGLATVYGIVKQSGGFIWVYSEPGLGSSFKIYLPRIEEAEEVNDREDVASVPQGTGEVILLVEDDPSLRELVRELLESGGYTVLGAANGSEALQIASGRERAVDLLLTDVIMPGLSGRAVADRLRERWPHLRVLFMSGYSDEAISRQGILDPGFRYLQKPFNEVALAEAVRSAVHDARD
jgi:two-component system, cell cycle sensor histidine kinase and response regulator CckA